MKIIKNSLIAVVLLTLGFFSNTVAQGFSIVGEPREDAEFVKMTISNYPQYFHKNEIADVMRDPIGGSYQFHLRSGKQYNINQQIFEALVQQIDYDTLKV